MNDPKFIVELDERELAVRIAEDATGLKRPAGMATADAYNQLDTSPHFDQFKSAARVSMLFFQEQVSNLKRVS